jgi:peroxiredoxin
MNRNALLPCLAAALLLVLTAAHPAQAFFGGGGGAAGLKVGETAPPWSGTTMDGQQLSSAQLKGKNVVVLDFWSIYCASCVEEMGKFVDIYPELNAKGLIIVAVNLDSFGVKRVEKFMQGMQKKINFPVIIDKDRQIATAMQAMVLPTTLIIGADGKVKYYHVGYKPGDENHLRTLVLEALKQVKK